MKCYLSIIILLVFGCSASAGGNGTTEIKANTYSTPGASYLCNFVVESGNCGGLPDQVININSDGTISLPIEMTCARSTVDGCSTHNSNCEWTYVAQTYRCNYLLNSESTFSSDGSRVTGMETISADCSDGSWCAGTYAVACVRR